MKKKNVLALVTVMAMSIAAGCGAQQTQPEDSESTAVTEQAPSDSEVQSTEESASDSEESDANESALETDTQEEETTQEVKAEKEDEKVNETGDVKEDMAEDVKEDEIPSHAMEQGWKFYPKDTVFSVDFANFVKDSKGNIIFPDDADEFESAEAIQSQVEINIASYGKRKPDENGIVTYLLEIDMKGEPSWNIKDGHEDYSTMWYYPGVNILDYYTGIRLPFQKNTYGDNEESSNADLEIDGKTYTVSYTDNTTWSHGKDLYTPHTGYWTRKTPVGCHHSIKIYAPQEYDGLVIGIGPITQEIVKDMNHSNGYSELDILGQKKDGTFDNLDDWYFFRLSEFKLH